jgi:glutamine amidotransferase
MSVTVVDYGAGNLRSVVLALQHLGAEYTVTDTPEQVAAADAIVFPGVGEGTHAMRVLTERGIDEALRSAHGAGIPILGICVGCQIVLDRSEEGDSECLGLIPGTATRFDRSIGLKIPHMGWNTVEYAEDHWLFDGIPQHSSFYFVHSYFPNPTDRTAVIAHSEYGGRFAAAIQRASLVAVQFHPEKSGRPGLALLRNYLARVGAVTGRLSE